jgi:hypothetical protein
MISAQLCGFVFVLSAATVWNFGFKWKIDGSLLSVKFVGLLIFLGDSSLLPLRVG